MDCWGRTAVILILLLIVAATITVRKASKSDLPQESSAELGKWFGIIFAAAYLSTVFPLPHFPL
jgi:hypothetical protein